MSKPLAVAVDVGGTSVKAGLVAADGTIHRPQRRAVADIGRPQLVDTVLDLVDELVRLGGRDTAGVGLTVAGLVDEHAGVAVSSMFLGWRDVPFVDLLARYGLPIAFGHDVSAGAFAESRRGAAVGHRDWLFVAVGTGVGSTFVLDDRPYRGANGLGGELAHVVVDPAGPVCPCGKRGCLETVASGPAIASAYAAVSGQDAVTARDVAERAAAGDGQARRVWDAATGALADVLVDYVESMNPSLVVVGGGVAGAGDRFLAPLRQEFASRVAFADPAPAAVPAHFRDDAAVVGIGLAALDGAEQGRQVTIPFFGSPRRGDTGADTPHHGGDLTGADA